MSNLNNKFFLAISLFFILSGCSPSSSSTATDTPQTHPPQKETLIVTSADDSGPGTFRQALLDAQSGDTITYDTAAFPPNAPATIYLSSGLPHISQGNLTIDASDAGLILDGSNILEGEWIPGLSITSDGNTIRGLQIVNFSGAGIAQEGAKHNIIGGDRDIGSGPIGQGNLSSKNSDGIILNSASDNTIMGNYIGTDITGLKNMGNRAPGIALEGNASHNILGPNNIIAFNGVDGGCGIEIRSENPQENEVTGNSIHDNSFAGICNDISTSTPPPIILGFDISAGLAEGISCPQCNVEIFSTSSKDGEIFEGQVIADDSGYFSFNNDMMFSGPGLTATAHSPDKNTSVFSAPTSGISKHVNIQEGNDLSKIRFQTKPSNELQDNRIGSQWDWFNATAADMQQLIDREILPAGLKRVQVTVNGKSPDTVNWEKPEFFIDPEDDQVFTRLAENGITITYVMTFWDKAIWPNGEGAECPRFKNEEEIQRYLDFVRFIVGHFKDRIQYYEIWGEPDSGYWNGEFFEPCSIQSIAIEDYISLVRRVTPVIREVYPVAKIVVGSTMSWVESGSREYLLSILSSDIMPLVDVVAWHPGYGLSPEYDHWREIYENYPSIVQEIKDVATAHGFQGEYTADEMVWWTEETAPPNEYYPYSEKKSAKYYARFIIMHLGMDVNILPGRTESDREVTFSTVRNLATIMGGAQPEILLVEIESQATDIMNYAFSLPNGDRLFALWTHGAASDVDPSISATLTFPGLSGGEVVGIDVLYGFEQNLISSNENGNLVIHDFLVKDYPVILYFKGASSP